MVESLFKDIIEANAPIMALLTGGVYTFAELGPAGLVPGNTVCADAFTLVNGINVINPCMVIRLRSDIPNFFRADSGSREIAYDGNVEFWCYQDKGYDTISSIAEKLLFLIGLKTFDGLGMVQPLGDLTNLVAPEFRNVSLIRSDYRIKRVKRGS